MITGKIKRLLVYGSIFICLVFVPLLSSAKEYDYINISNPFLRKTPIAVTSFKTFTRSSQEIENARKAERILKNALDFTGYLKTMNPEAFLSDPAESGIQLGEISFKDWTSIGAELLVTGGITESFGNVKLQLRLFDTFNTKLLVGKVYSGSPNQLRKMIHLFCSEISLALTGTRGVFDSKIAFISTVNGKKEVFTCDFDGYDVKQVTEHKSICLSPSWSYDKKWLAYVSFAKGGPQIFIRNIKYKTGSIVNYSGTNISPDWMPGELTLAASLSFSGDPEIYLLTGKGKITKRVTNSWGIDVSPDFSPDGKKIVFTSKRTGTPQIYMQDIESGQTERLTFKGSNNTSPAWSPDGSKIAYVGIVSNEIDIYVMDIHSKVPVQLTEGRGDNEDPSWSPDGSMIAFTSSRNGGMKKIFVMNASGTDQRQLLNLQGRQNQPDWSMP